MVEFDWEACFWVSAQEFVERRILGRLAGAATSPTAPTRKPRTSVPNKTALAVVFLSVSMVAARVIIEQRAGELTTEKHTDRR
jgi:hypothetical protein